MLYQQIKQKLKKCKCKYIYTIRPNLIIWFIDIMRQTPKTKQYRQIFRFIHNRWKTSEASNMQVLRALTELGSTPQGHFRRRNYPLKIIRLYRASRLT